MRAAVLSAPMTTDVRVEIRGNTATTLQAYLVSDEGEVLLRTERGSRRNGGAERDIRAFCGEVSIVLGCAVHLDAEGLNV